MYFDPYVKNSDGKDPGGNPSRIYNTAAAWCGALQSFFFVSF